VPDQLIQFEGGDILANLEERTITGLLLPYNEIGSTNIGRFQVVAAAIPMPTDPSIIGLNIDHERSEPVGRAIKLWEQPQGIMATFKIADTPEGDAALLDATTPTGKRRKLSAEFHAIIKAGKAIGGRLWGAALVNQGAFPSAQVLAMDTPVETGEHLEITVEELPEHITATTPAGDSADYIPAATPAADQPERESSVTVTAEAPATAPALIPPTQTAGAPVLVSVAAILSPMWPDLPTPTTTILARFSTQCWSVSTAWAKESSIRTIRRCNSAISRPTTRRAFSR